jgi:hypothetical protein
MNEPFPLESDPVERISARTFRARLGVTEGGFRWLRARGRIPEPTRVKGRVFWTPDVVERCVTRRRHRYGS